MSNLSEVAKQPVNIPKGVPENWIWRDLVDMCRPKQWATISSGELSETGYPVFGANGYIGFYPNYNHEFETIAVTCRGATCGTVNLIPGKTYITGNSMCLDDVHDSIDTKFLFYSAKYRTFSDVISGSAQPQITGEGLKKVSLPVPPFAEQKKIATILTYVDKVIEKTQKQIDKLQDLKKATMNELLTKGIGHTDFQNTELGSIPQSWQSAELSEFCKEVVVGHVGSTSNYYTKEAGIKFLRTGDLKNGEIRLTEIMHITREFHQKLKKSSLREGDVLVSRVGDTGQAALVPKGFGEANCANIIIIRCGEKLLPQFLKLFINSEFFFEQVTRVSIGSAQAVLNIAIIKQLIISLPELAEQRKICQIVNVIDDLILKQKNKGVQLQSLKKSLMQDLLTGKVRVQVN